MDERDRRLRNATYRLLAALGRVPRAEETAADLGWRSDDVMAGWRRLHDAHALVLHPNGEIRMANPFSAAPSAHRVWAAGRSWFANCAWDALGIPAALGVDARVSTTCPDCGDGIDVEIAASEPSDASLVFHCLVPARHWWDDIGFT